MKSESACVVSMRNGLPASFKAQRTCPDGLLFAKRLCLAFAGGLGLLWASSAFADELDQSGNADFYVATTGNDANDGSQATPFATLGAAITAANTAIDGGAEAITIQVAAGTYTGSGYVLENAITVCGAGAGETVFDGNGGYRVFSLLSSGATLKNLCVSNAVFTAAEDSGAGVYMEAGLVEDCAIVSCGDFSWAKASGGGIFASGGRIRRTVFTGNKVHTRWSGDVGYGSALFLSNRAICENSLFTGNATASCFDWDATQRRGGVVHLTGDGTTLVNCTVVENRLAHLSGNNNNNYAGIVQKLNAKVVNCVAYGNSPDAAFAGSSMDVFGGGDTSRNNWQNYFVNSTWGSGMTRDSTAISPDQSLAIDVNAFADYANGDYAPASGGPLFSAGSDAQYATYATSATDLAGVARSQGTAIEIGCYEVDESFFAFSAEANSYGVLLGTASTFTATAIGGGGNYTYKWNFGDGSAEQITANPVVQHTYAAGLYQASVSVSLDGGTTWVETAEPVSAVAVAPADIYVDAANANPEFPYDTPAKAATAFADAYGCLTNTIADTLDMAVVDGTTIHVAAGTYVGSGYVLAGDIAVVGAGETVFDGNGGYRVFSLLSSGAALKNLCVSNAVFTAAEDSGAGVYMEAGLVEDCAIVSCGDFSWAKASGGGIFASGGRISRTVFTGNKVHMKWSSNVGYGSALYLSNGAVCENSLFTGNAAAPCFDWDANHRRGGVVHLSDAGTVLVNCTVVKNGLADAYGNAKDSFAGIVQKSNSKVVNCVAYGNVPAAEYAESHGDVYAGGDTYRYNWQNFFFNSAWGTWIAKTVAGNTVTTPSPIDVDATAFRNYADGNYSPKSGGVLMNAGTSWNDYLGYGARSETDFAGNARCKSSALDIGCFEGVWVGFMVIVR